LSLSGVEELCVSSTSGNSGSNGGDQGEVVGSFLAEREVGVADNGVALELSDISLASSEAVEGDLINSQRSLEGFFVVVGNCNSAKGEDEEDRDEGEEFVHDLLRYLKICLLFFLFFD